jgi:hypothetical protein
MVNVHAETTIALEELKKKCLKESEYICVTVLETVSNVTGVEFGRDYRGYRLITKNGVLRVGFAYETSYERCLYSILFYNRKKDGEESSR